VLLVVLYHLQVRGVGGGLFGVDIFFVLSGFLITGLLLKEWERRGAISLSRFWARRARRLLPALLVVLAAVILLWRNIGESAEFDVARRDALATLFYVANWHSIFAGHTWSLSVEEQFYVVWPLVVVGVLAWKRSTRPLLILAASAGALSVAWMFFLSVRGADPSRLYFGTDTRAQTILTGAVLAIVFHEFGYDITGARTAGKHSRQLPPTVAFRAGVSVAGAVGLAFIMWAALRPEGQQPWLYRGGLFALALAADAVLVSVLLVPRSIVARLLDARPLRALGLISYGVYLIHWPVIVYLTPQRAAAHGWQLQVIRGVVTLVLAVVSYYLIELPIRERRLVVALPLVKVSGAVAAVCLLSLVIPAPRNTDSTLTALAHAAPPPTPPSAPPTIPTPSTTLPPEVLAGAVTHPGPMRVMIEGDSVAWSLGLGIAPVAPSAGFVFANEGYVGCGIATGGQTSFAAYTQPAACLTWQERWKSQVDYFRPDVTLVLLGRWELVDRVHDGVWMHIGEPAYDQYLRSQLDAAISTLTSDGGRVALLSAPCNDQALADAAAPGRLTPDDANRVLLFNQLLTQEVAAHPGVTELVPFRDLVCPGGQYEQYLNGYRLRTSDGVHMEPYAGSLFVGQLWPQISHWLSQPAVTR
jgi:peptidoglycan/LPS O-acetylase OafA/YrhL